MKKIFISLILLIGCLGTAMIHGADYYVATTGNNSNPGTEAQPFATIQYAANLMGPGDTVYIKGGTYTSTEIFEWSTSLEIYQLHGTETAPITFQAYQQANGKYDTVILDAELTHSRSVWVHESSYIIIDGLTAIRGKSDGFRFGGGSYGTAPDVEPVDHIIVRNCVAYDNGRPNTWRGAFMVTAASHHVVFDRCEAYDNGGGFWAGVPHKRDKSVLPFNITFKNSLAYNHTKGGGNSNGFVFMGAYNSLMSNCVAFGNSDTGMGSQGPHCDNNILNTWLLLMQPAAAMAGVFNSIILIPIFSLIRLIQMAKDM